VPQSHKIARVHATPLRVISDFSWLGVDKQNAASACFVEVETDTGLKGHGITQHSDSAAVAVQVNNVGPKLHGLDALANERIKTAGLAGRCEVRVQDYRDVPGEGVFDKIASIGMFEHVGLKNLPVYFGAIRRLLADGGIVLNHGLTSVDPDSRAVGLGAGEFIGKYVFPHGELPHLSLVIREMGAAGLEVMDSETLRLHYAKTLQQWSERLEANLEKARAFAGEKRLRIWRTYLAGCAHAFAQGWVSIQQVLAVKSGDPRQNPLPWTRDYMVSR